ncbi:MAG: hypothetical protein ACRDJ2_11320 [Actinomycetota bacterium]
MSNDEKGAKSRKGVTRRRFLATTTTGAAATLLHSQGALAGVGSAAPTKTKSLKTPKAVSGKTIRHSESPMTELLSSSNASVATMSETSPFGRMFPTLPAHNPTDQALVNLASSVLVPRPSLNPHNTSIDAGVTYIGQFIDHDITFDEVASLLGPNDPNGLNSTRSARYDLDSVYGGVRTSARSSTAPRTSRSSSSRGRTAWTTSREIQTAGR